MKTQKFYDTSLVAALWVFVLFNMTFRDFHQFLNDGYIEQMMHSTVTELELLFYALILEIPILMTVLSRVLKAKINKWVNTIAALLMAIGMAMSLFSADLDDMFFTTMELMSLAFIVHISWKLSKNEKILGKG